MHYKWYNELHRILKPGGILFITSQGDNFLPKLTASEKEKYLKGNIIVRGDVKEGHRTFSAFHPNSFMNRLFSNATVLEHNNRKDANGKYPAQDIWIVKK